MKEREIIEQLNKLKSINAESRWKENNRSILVSQIFGSQTEEKKFEFNWPLIFIKEMPFQMVQSVPKSFAAAILTLVFLASAGTASIIAARESKPGDSLYVAKIAGEKAQYALTFNDEDKAKLGMEFAGNRAEEISKVLAETPSDKKDETVVNLVNDFKKEINNIRTKLEKNKPAENSSLAKNTDSKTDSIKNINNNANKNNADDDGGKFFGADIGKDDKGVDVSAPAAAGKTEKTTTTPAVEEKPAVSTTTPKALDDPKTLLEEAKVFLDNKNYDETLNKLEAADKAINQVGQEPVKEEVKTEATTTEVKK
jgi:hypothetical protein